ncbi:hypothetical protein MLD52_03880 [Puniceicoccaceae bacterium K14]|nr:hypothetical protein [Puniceicoccaceae bacterium K14]
MLPENIAQFSKQEYATIQKMLHAFAQTHHTSILVGLSHKHGETVSNQATLFHPDQTEHAYTKRHLIPGLENAYTKGDSLTKIQKYDTNWGIAICKDLDFVDTGKDYGKRSINLLLVPAWDFGDDAYLHARMATLRGVESGFAIARSSRNGNLSISDNRGRILSETPVNGDAFTTLVHTFNASHTPTLYLALGDWLGWACLITSLVSLKYVFKKPLMQGDPNK